MSKTITDRLRCARYPPGIQHSRLFYPQPRSQYLCRGHPSLWAQWNNRTVFTRSPPVDAQEKKHSSWLRSRNHDISSDKTPPDGEGEGNDGSGNRSTTTITTTTTTTTITARERETFNRIFRHIVTSASTSPRRAPYSPGSGDAGLKGHRDPAEGVGADARADRDGLSFTPGRPGGTTEDTRREREMRALMRYPESLRATAAETTRIAQELSRARSMGKAVAVVGAERQDEEGQSKELNRVMDLIQGAQTDRQLWDILHQEVFSMVKRLDEHGDNAKDAKAKPRKGRRKSAARIKSSPQPTPSTDVVSALAIIGPTYPHLLLLAMRFFRYEFQLPSACLALFAHVKALGPISYVLGATTALYNEMIGLRWRSYGDFYAVDELLTEMERGGVEFDEETLLLLQGIWKERSRASRGELGPVMKGLWDLEGLRQGLRRVGGWKDVVADRLIEEAIMAEESKEQVDYA